MSLLEDMKLNPLLEWLSGMIQLSGSDELTVPKDYHSQVKEVKSILKNDSSGLVNTILDFYVNCALVQYSVETSNKNLTDLLNRWLDNVNFSLRGKIPVGIMALAKEYFRERWKASSLLVLRTIWEDQNGYILPTKLWFVDGEDVVVKDGSKDGAKRLGDEQYSLIISGKKSAKKTILLPNKKDEKIFVQKPYAAWGDIYPTPFVIQRGIYRNLKFLQLLEKKGDFVVSKALEYLLLLKKGNATLAAQQNPDFIYNKEDLETIKQDLSDFLQKRKTNQGVSTYVTGFDTELEHSIPEYGRILAQELYSPTERKLLAGLGLIDIIQGITSTRRESVLSPKPLITEVEDGINDFKTLLTDIMLEIIEVNKFTHKKYFNKMIQIHTTPIKQFIDRDLRQMMRSIYDRGGLSKQTFVDVVGGLDYKVELRRRQREQADSEDIIMYPPVIQNVEQNQYIPDFPEDLEDKNKKGPEKKNFNLSRLELQQEIKDLEDELDEIENEIDDTTDEDTKQSLIDEQYDLQQEIEDKKNQLQEMEVALKQYESAPYKNVKNLPEQVKVLPKHGQLLWMEVFNKSYPTHGEDYARRVAWFVVKKVYHKNKKGKWVKKTKGSIGTIEELLKGFNEEKKEIKND